MRERMPGDERRANDNMHTPAFSVQDEIKRNRRIERNKRIRRARAAQHRAFVFVICFVVLLITVLAVLLAVMRARTVTVSGNSRYSAEQILEAADINGGILPLIGDDAVYKKVVAVCPYVNDIELKKTYPSAVEIAVIEADVKYCADIHGRRYSLDADLRVIEFTEKTDGLIKLTLPEVVSAVEGSRVVFGDERHNTVIADILGELCGGTTSLEYTSINLSNRFAISAVVSGNIKINFGDYNSIPLKLNAAIQLIDKAEQQHSVRTLINVSTLSSTGPSMILDYDGEF